MDILTVIEVGSSLFVNNPKDKDFLIIVSNDTTDEEICNLKQILPKETDYFIFREEKPYMESQKSHFLYIAQLVRENRLAPQYGKFLFKPDDKELLECAINHNSFNLKLSHIKGGAAKYFYFVLLILFYFRNGNCSLNEYEREQIQIAHDGYYPKDKLPQIREELIKIYEQRFGPFQSQL